MYIYFSYFIFVFCNTQNDWDMQTRWGFPFLNPFFWRNESYGKKSHFSNVAESEPKVQRITEQDGLGVSVSGLYMRGNGFESGQGYQITLGLWRFTSVTTDKSKHIILIWLHFTLLWIKFSSLFAHSTQFSLNFEHQLCRKANKNVKCRASLTRHSIQTQPHFFEVPNGLF